jgi:putative transposase
MMPSAARQRLIEQGYPEISLRHQCELLGVQRSNLYYLPRPMSDENMAIMNLIDHEYLRHPFYGSPKLTESVREAGWIVNHKRIERLMQLMGIQAIMPKRNLSKKAQENRVFPYLLRGLAITRPNQVWSTDVTYVPMEHGFMYLTAVIDWFSRYVLAWDISNTFDAAFCVAVVRRAFEILVPEIFNTDQGAQYTSDEFTGFITSTDAKFSMDGRGRALDNVFIERLWRSVKYEEIYLHSNRDGYELRDRLDQYFRFFNNERFHAALGYQTPAAVYGSTPLKLAL